jgi:hypothetical protein
MEDRSSIICSIAISLPVALAFHVFGAFGFRARGGGDTLDEAEWANLSHPYY